MVLTHINFIKGPPKMDNETARRLDSLEGQVLALQTAMRALIACHPTPVKAIATVTAHLDEMSGMVLAGNSPNDFVDAVTGAELALLPSDTQIANARSR